MKIDGVELTAGRVLRVYLAGCSNGHQGQVQHFADAPRPACPICNGELTELAFHGKNGIYRVESTG